MNCPSLVISGYRTHKSIGNITWIMKIDCTNFTYLHNLKCKGRMTPKIQFFVLGRSLCNFVNVESVDSLNCLGYNS